MISGAQIRCILGRSFKAHSDAYKLRLYLALKENNDHKYRNVKHLVEPDEVQKISGEDLDLNGSPAAGVSTTPIEPLREREPAEPDEPDQRDGSWDPSNYHAHVFGDDGIPDHSNPDLDCFMPTDT